MLGDALGVGDDRARAILALLTCAPADTKTLFSRGVWATPLLPAPGSDECYILLAPLLFGSPVKRIEAFMVRGGISDNKGVKGRGKPFEVHVRQALATAIEANPALSRAVVYPAAIGRKKQGEEIDLLVQIGSTVIVGEVKCFVAPSEALERYNYLRNLSDAARQSRNKLEWAQDNRAEIAALLGVTDPSDVASLAFQPVVVLNQGFGTGLSRFRVPIVDLAYLKLLLGNDHYQSRTRFERDVGMAYATVPLYADQANLEARLAERLENPVVLKRFEGAVGWRDEPFAWEDIKIALPTLLRAPDGDETIDNFDAMDVAD